MGFLLLLTLTTFAFAQSVYQAIAGNPEFIALNRISHSDLLLIMLCFNIVLPTVLSLVSYFIRCWSGRAADIFLSLCLLGLLTLFLFELHRRFVAPLLRFSHNTLLVAIPIAVAATLIFRYRPVFERFLLLLSPVIVILPALFLATTWREVSAIAPARAGGMQSVTSHAGRKSHPPIFLLVFDEFTRPALLDRSGHIDADRFPHFAELAQHSTWFANATSNADSTTRSIPVIVSGNFPHGNDASDAAYPNNMFRLLAPEYNITIHEFASRFCVSAEYRCPDAQQVERQDWVLWSVLELYLRRVAPKSVVLRLESAGLRREQRRFRGFLDEIGASSSERPVLEFVHIGLPHAPYMLNADGSIHDVAPNGGRSTVPAYAFDRSFAGDLPLLRHVREDYLKQIQYVDRELGKFLEKLKQHGLFKQSLIVITSDHGVSWKTANPGRTLTTATADMIFPVPMFLKLPGRTVGEVSQEDVQLIDLLPTVAVIAGVHLPWHVAGRNIFGTDRSPREKVMYDIRGKKFVYPSHFASIEFASLPWSPKLRTPDFPVCTGQSGCSSATTTQEER